MEIVEISDLIQQKIALLEKGRKELSKRAEAKANATMEYEKSLGMTLLKLKNNAIQEHEGFPVTDLPMSIIEKVAKSIVWKEKLNAEKTEVFYRNAIVGLNAIESELNGYQSIFKFMKEV